MNKDCLKSELDILNSDEIYVLLKELFCCGSSRIWDFEETLRNLNVEDYKGDSQC